MKFTIPPILSKSLLKIAANAFLSVGCLLMVSCDGGLLALGASEASNDDSNSSPPVSEQGLAPNSLNGITISLDDSGLLLAITENIDAWFLIEESLVDGTTGTFTYNASGNTGTATLKAIDGDVATVVLEFNSESTGTYVISSSEESESGSFRILDVKAPSSLAGREFNVKEFDLFSQELIDEFPISFSDDGVTFTSRQNDNSGEIIYTAEYIYAANGVIGNFEKLTYTETTNGELTDQGETVNSLLFIFITEDTGVWVSFNNFDFGVGSFEIIGAG